MTTAVACGGYASSVAACCDGRDLGEPTHGEVIDAVVGARCAFVSSHRLARAR